MVNPVVVASLTFYSMYNLTIQDVDYEYYSESHDTTNYGIVNNLNVKKFSL